MREREIETEKKKREREESERESRDDWRDREDTKRESEAFQRVLFRVSLRVSGNGWKFHLTDYTERSKFLINNKDAYSVGQSHLLGCF